MPVNNSKYRKAERRDDAAARRSAHAKRPIGAQLDLIAARPGKSAREVARLTKSGTNRDALIETLNILSDPDTMAALAEAENEV